ncbi:MAG: cell surface protein SprA, partial [Coprobacter sp.]|nr:cell surface protein SprA [Coprobacter sp.]
FGIQWNMMKALNFSLSTMTNARVDEPAGIVNKKLFPDEFEAWKDTVMRSIVELGRPWNYNQVFNASFDAPFNRIPVLDWINFSVKYNSTYAWNRGVAVDAETNLGNNINNQGQWNFDSRFNLESLYNKSKFLKNVNRKFSSSSRGSASGSQKKKPYTRQVQLKKDTTVAIRHNLDNKRVIVTAKGSDGKVYPVKYRVVDRNNIVLLTKDSVRISLTVASGKRMEDEKWYKALEYTSRFAMMVRNVNVRYRRSNTMNVPSFKPNVGDIFGQSAAYDVLAPGLDFAFGLTGEEYIRKIMEKDWLIVNDSLVSPVVVNRTEEVQIDASVEPFKGLKISLNANRTHNHNNQVQFMYEGMPRIQGGNFTMTHVAIKTALKPSKAGNGYSSRTFDNFLAYRQVIADRIGQMYTGHDLRYPRLGYIAQGSPQLAGTLYNPQNGGVNLNSADVMIPAFIAAYSGKDPNKVGLTAFPSLKSLLPNWRITYDGLGKIKALQKHFRSITLSHAYRCTYSVGSFASYLNWLEADGAGSNGWGFVLDELSGNPVPSSPFDISSVSITESFAPLIGIDMTMNNNVTLRAEYKDSRNLSLNSAAGQIVESSTQDITVGAGYKIVDLNAVLKMKSGRSGNFSNDLTLRADWSFRKTLALIRRIEQNFTQATSGTRTMMLKVSADYALSRYITLRAFYERQINTPLVSSTAYPISDSNFGIAVRLSLVR